MKRVSALEQSVRRCLNSRVVSFYKIGESLGLIHCMAGRT